MRAGHGDQRPHLGHRGVLRDLGRLDLVNLNRDHRGLLCRERHRVIHVVLCNGFIISLQFVRQKRFSALTYRKHVVMGQSVYRKSF